MTDDELDVHDEIEIICDETISTIKDLKDYLIKEVELTNQTVLEFGKRIEIIERKLNIPYKPKEDGSHE